MNSRTTRRQTIDRIPVFILVAALLALTGAAEAATISAPDTVITRGATVDVPVYISGAPLADGITGVDVFVRYDSTVVTASGIDTAGAATSLWTIATNIVEGASGTLDELRISAAASDPMDVPGTGVLFYITFTAKDLTAGGSTAITFELAEVNEAAAGTIVDGSIAIGGYTGALSLSPSAILPGAGIDVTLVDADLAGAGSATVTLANGANGDTVVATLGEGPSGTFTGTVPTAYDAAGAGGGTTGDGVLGAKAGASISATYEDDLDAAGGASTVTTDPGDEVAVNGGDTGDVVLGPADVTPGESITVQLTDADLAGDVNASVVVLNQTTGDVVPVTLTETGAGTGVFTGTVPTIYDSSASGTAGDADLGIKKNDVVTYAYADALADDGGPASVTTPAGSELTVNGGSTGSVALTPSALEPGDDLTVTLVDADLAAAGSAVVTVLNDNGDSVVVTLLPVAGSPGTLTADIPTTYDDGTPPATTGDGILGVAQGDQVTWSYDDALNDDGGPETVTTPAGSELTVNGGDTGAVTLTPTSIVPGDDLTVTLVDADLVAAGSAVVTIYNDNGDSVVVTLLPVAGSPGTFAADIPTIYDDGTPPPTTGDGILGIAEDDVVTWTYEDAKNDDGGPQTVTTPGGQELVILGGTTGTIVASAAVQAGDSLRIAVTDADLNTDPLVVEQVDVVVTNQDNGDVETVTLTEDGVNSALFKVTPPFPTASTNGTGVLLVDAEDTIMIEYTDVSDDVGATVVVDTTATGVLWGDTSKNGTVRALDASLILRENVGLETFDSYQLLVGDVNRGAGAPNPIADDAVYILQYAVGIISSFPVQGATPEPHPYKLLADSRRLALGAPLAQASGVALPLVVNEVDGILSGNLTLRYDPRRVSIGAIESTAQTSDFLVEGNAADGTLRIAFAGAAAQASGAGALVTIHVEALGGDLGATPLHLEEALLNGGRTAAQVLASAAALSVPQAFELQQNWPNPFNPETTLRYQLAAPGTVRLQIYDALGQVVRVLVDGHQAAGSYSVRWDGMNAGGLRVATGVYFYTLEAGGAVQTRRMTLLR